MMLQRILFTMGFTVLLATHGLGQQAGQIVGVVTDSSGGVLPGATVKAIEVGTGFVRTILTGSDDTTAQLWNADSGE